MKVVKEVKEKTKYKGSIIRARGNETFCRAVSFGKISPFQGIKTELRLSGDTGSELNQSTSEIEETTSNLNTNFLAVPTLPFRPILGDVIGKGRKGMTQMLNSC